MGFTDADGMRITSVLNDTPPGIVPGHATGLKDRIREAKATGLCNLPCRGLTENAA